MPRQLKRIPFGPYAPDLPEIVNQGGLTVARNTLPIAGGYEGFPGLGAGLTGFTPLPERPRGSTAFIDRSGNPYNFVGTSDSLYKLSNDGNEDVTRATGGPYQCNEDLRWEFAVYGQHVIAVNPGDESQFYTIGSVSSEFARIDNAPRAAHIGVVGSFAMMGNTFDPINGIAENAIHWSAVGNALNWPTTGTDVAVSLQSDRQVLENAGGAVQRVVSGAEVGVIFQERSIWRADYTGGDVVFSLTRVEPDRGLLIPAVAIQFGRFVFYLAEDGFYIFDYTTSMPVGRDMVDGEFLSDVDTAHFDRVTATQDPDTQRIFIAYPGSGNTAGAPNKMLVYDWGEKQWSHADVAVAEVTEVVDAGVHLDSPDNPPDDPDTDGVDGAGLGSFDARQSPFGGSKLGAYDSSFQLTDFSGTTLEATLETGLLELVPGYRAMLSDVRVLVSGASAKVRVASRSVLNDTDTFRREAGPNRQGSSPVHVDGRYHKIRAILPAGWTQASAMDLKFQQGGTR